MVVAAVYRYGADGTHGAEVFAGSAANAYLFVHRRDSVTQVLVLHHLYCSYGAVACAVSAFGAFLGDAEAAVYMGGSYVIFRFFFAGDGDNGPGRAELRTTGAFRAAVSFFVCHLGLHEAGKVG